jgi:inward rectifier potassium channel
MAFFNKINTKSKQELHTGFGTDRSKYGSRFMDKNGKPNVRIEGISLLKRISLFHTLIHMKSGMFIVLILLFFVAVNLIFAGLYTGIGIEQIGGIQHTRLYDQFLEAFFFSCQTFTTVGYGRLNPVGHLSSLIAAIEAFSGLLSFAIITGLLYGRFSLPTAYIKFCDKMVIAPFQQTKALMLRLAPYKNSTYTDAEAKVLLALSVEENGVAINRFYELDLEYNKVNALTLNWTIVHPINETSPLWGMSREDLLLMKAEIIVFLKAFDESFSNSVLARSSYNTDEILWGHKFVPMFDRSIEGSKTILNLKKLSETIEANLSFADTSSAK